MPRRKLWERLGDAWSILRGVQRATGSAEPGRDRIVRLGSPPDSMERFLSPEYEYFASQTQLNPDRIATYDDMEEMFSYVIVASALEAYVEDATQTDPKTKRAVWVESENPSVVEHSHRLFDLLEMNERVVSDMYGMGKLGDNFQLLVTEKDHGVVNLVSLEPRIVHRIEDRATRRLSGFFVGAEYEAGTTIEPNVKPWEMLHYSLRHNFSSPYGTGLFSSIRRTFKTLKLMEEQMAIYRMKMHPDRLLFKIFAGSAGPDERFALMNRWRQAMERTISINHQANRMTAEYAPWAVSENIYFPVGDGSDNSSVEKLGGSANVGELFDIQYQLSLLFAGLRIPKAYLGFEDSQGYRGWETLSQQSIKFARSVKRLQRFDLANKVRLLKIHLPWLGVDPSAKGNEFSVRAVSPNYLDDVYKAEAYGKRAEAVRALMDIGSVMSTDLGINRKVWAHYVLSEFGGLEPKLIAKLLASAEGTPDLVFTPGTPAPTGTSSVGIAQATQEEMNRNPVLQEAVRILAQCDDDVASVCQSSRDPFVLPNTVLETASLSPDDIAGFSVASDTARRTAIRAIEARGLQRIQAALEAQKVAQG